MRERFEKGMYLSSAGDRRRAISFFESELKSLKDELEEEMHPLEVTRVSPEALNWNKALLSVLKLIDERMK